mgnify:CR=1 FL=1
MHPSSLHSSTTIRARALNEDPGGDGVFFLAQESGLTLVELIMTILIMGILAAGTLSFVTSSTQTYVDTATRNQLSALGRSAIMKIDYAISEAVPNTIRIKMSADKSEQCFEYLPMRSSAYYTQAPFSDVGATVDVIHLANTTGGDYALIYPMSAGEVYAESNPGPIAGVSSTTATAITLSNNHRFSSRSPGSRVYYAGAPVSFCITNNKLYRWQYVPAPTDTGYAFSSSQCLPSQPAGCLPSSAPVRAMIADGIDNAAAGLDAFEYEIAGLSNAGLFRVSLKFSDGNESVLIRHDIQIKNVQ